MEFIKGYKYYTEEEAIDKLPIGQIKVDFPLTQEFYNGND